jgi:hypothetical protein
MERLLLLLLLLVVVVVVVVVIQNGSGLTHPPIQWVPKDFSLGVKRSGREADHSPPSSAEVSECVELYLHSPIRLHSVVIN